MLSITYEIDIKSVGDRSLSASIEASHAIAAVMVPGKFLVDVIPIRAGVCTQTVTYEHPTDPLVARYIPDWFPGTGFKALVKEARNKFNVSVGSPLEYVKNAMKVSPRSVVRLECILNLNITTSPASEFLGP